MRNTLLSIMLFGGLFGGPSEPEKGQEKYEEKKYAEALTHFQTADTLDDYRGQQFATGFNAGQCFLNMDSLARATALFSKSTNLNKEQKGRELNRQVASWAWNNIGYGQVKQMEAAQQQGASPMGGGNMMPPTGPQGAQADAKDQILEALNSFKNALRQDPDNDIARYNYELLQRRMQQQQQQQQEDQQDQDDEQQQNQDQDQQQQQEQQQDQKEKDQQQKEKPKPNPDNQENKGQNKNQNQGQSPQEPMEMQQAKQLLEAMNEKEKQFIQQLEKKRQKGKPKRNDGPDW